MFVIGHGLWKQAEIMFRGMNYTCGSEREEAEKARGEVRLGCRLYRKLSQTHKEIWI